MAHDSADRAADQTDQPPDNRDGMNPDDDWLRHGRSFGSVAKAYAQLRPGYPSVVVEFIVGGPTEPPTRHTPLRVLDLGAGTGKLTGLFLAAGHDVIAVDPALEMLSELSLSHPEVSTAVGTAESIPLPDDSVDVLIAGQAAHWFDLETAVPEIARVLCPDGVLGLIWNLRDEQIAWVAALGVLMAAEGGSVSSDLDGIAGDVAERLGWELTRAEFGYAQTLTPDDVVAGLATRSYVALLDDAERGRLLDSVRDLLATHPDTVGRGQIDVPYRTFAYRLELQR